MSRLKNTLMALGIMFLGALPSFQAKASILIEPHLGYNMIGGGTTAGTKYSYNGPQYGMKLGAQYLGLMAGVDYNLSSYTWKRETALATTNDKFDRNELGVFVGYNLPILLRVWGAYYFSHTAKDQEASGVSATGDKYKGNAKEIGLGFTGLPFLSLNLIYRSITIDEQSLASTAQTTITGGDVSNHEILLGVSLPLTFL
ncbi:MAG: hypothetical protein KBD76_14145 [Bacteriovorax sp.]|nr:hypothetical protein [Bacteriovorax sp.]